MDLESTMHVTIGSAEFQMPHDPQQRSWLEHFGDSAADSVVECLALPALSWFGPWTLTVSLSEGLRVQLRLAWKRSAHSRRASIKWIS